LKIGINLALIQKLGFLGLALGTSIASLLNTGLLLNALRKKIGNLGGHEVLSTLLRITLASVLMGVAAWLLHSWLATQIGITSLQQKSIVLGITIVVSIVLLMLLSYLFKVKEAKTILELVARRSKKISKAD
jgi:putative peptidoglycan lipid II flippase